ncbi:phasin [Methylobacterium durans]|uniref:Phasin n=1 Tax=Methylobacterium durans TaxID=2202825 RepID=A0A2U8W9I4_9HYPH|nr:phasin [Methylobacterium durans]AWN42649.1 phasin [Methylobacterium durans]
MNDTPRFEIPDSMRDLAEKSVGQARQAFDSFISTARRTSAQVQDSAESARQSAAEMTARSFQAAEQNVHAAFDFAQKLARANSAQEAMQLQSEFTRSQFAAMQAQAKELGGMAQGAMRQGAEQARSALQQNVDQTRNATHESAGAMEGTAAGVNKTVP